MRRELVIAGALALVGVGLGVAGARSETTAPAKAPVEIWGVGSADHVEIDGAAVPVKAAATRAFAGDPTAMNAPILRELGEGRHEIVVEREGCEPRRFTIDVQGALKRSVVLVEPSADRCGIPLAPPRSDGE